MSSKPKTKKCPKCGSEHTSKGHYDRLPINLDSFKKVATKVRAYKEQMLTQEVQESEQTVPPSERYADVGGLKGVMEEIIKEVTLSLHPQMAGDKWQQPRGYLFYGPPGTGKTLLAKAIAGENKVTILVTGGASLMSKMAGDSEKSVRQIFARARAKSPSIIFWDEIDAIGRARGSSIGGNASMQESMLNVLFTQLDGFNPKGRVVFIGATNMKDTLDPGLLRRLDKQFEFSYPKTTAEKLSVIKAQWRKFEDTGSEVTPEAIVKLFLAKTFSPSVCADVIAEAARMSQMESIACAQMLEAMYPPPDVLPDEIKQRTLRKTFADEFDRIAKRIPKESIISESGEVVWVPVETDLEAEYRKVADNNPITMQHMSLAFEKKATTDDDRAKRRYNEMHRSRESEVGKGYGLSTEGLDATKGNFLTIECRIFPSAKSGQGKVNCYGNLGVGAKESAYMARDLIRAYSPSIMNYDISLHIISLAEGTEQVAVSGPSAGQAMLFTILSRWLDLPFNKDVCMTGKVDLNGIVGIVGGIQPKSGAGKLDAARENGFKYCLIPLAAFEELQKDWADYLEASFDQGCQIFGGKTWIDYAQIVFDNVDLEQKLRAKN